MDTGTNRKVTNHTGSLIHGQLAEQFIGICYQIHSQYGFGQKETVYQNALAEKLLLSHIPFEKEVSISINSVDSGKKLGQHRLDFVIDKKAILELKYTPQKLEQQLYSYLRNTPFQVGQMLNFGSSKLFVRRIILTR